MDCYYLTPTIVTNDTLLNTVSLIRTVGHISIGPEGTIVSIDPEAEALFQV